MYNKVSMVVRDTSEAKNRTQADGSRLANKNAEYKNIAEDFILGSAKKAEKKKSEYSDVNKAVYSFTNGKVLSDSNLKRLAKELGVDYNNAKKSGNLYKKLKSLGIKGFKDGSSNILEDQLALVAEEGREIRFNNSQGQLEVLGRGDKVFTKEMSDNLWKQAQMNFADMIPVMPQLNLTPVKVPKFDLNMMRPIQPINVDGDIIMNGVNDKEEFAKQLRNTVCGDEKTAKCIAEVVSNKQLGRKGVGNARLWK